jgi:hypothetical protein
MDLKILNVIWIEIPCNGHMVKAFWLFNYLKISQCCNFFNMLK